jgi:hypothetical protein
MKRLHVLRLVLLACSMAFPITISAEGIVSKLVNSPLSATGLVKGAGVGINVYLQSDEVQGMEFMDPNVIGYGVDPGGYIEIEMGGGYERISEIEMAQKTIMVVTGVPQQGMPGKAVGYEVGEGSNPNIILITPTKSVGLVAENLMSPAPGAKNDPVRSRGIKVFHIGLLQSAFRNGGDTGLVTVRFVDGAGSIVHEGSASIDFIDGAVPQIQPTNFPDQNRSHNWQVVKSGDTLGVSVDTVPIAAMLYAKADGADGAAMGQSKKGIVGAGVLSTQKLKALEYEKPEALARYNGGLILQDSNNDGQLDPKVDKIIGGIIGKAPEGASGQEIRSLVVHGAIDLSKPTTAYHAKFGDIFGGAVMLLQFTAGDKIGKYRPTLALLSDPADISSGDGSSYTFTIVVE